MWKRIFQIASGLEITWGGAMTVWHQIPAAWGYPLLVFGLIVILASAIGWYQEAKENNLNMTTWGRRKIPLDKAVMAAWEEIRDLPYFMASPGHSPEFNTLRDYYEKEPVKLPGIVAQIIFNNAHPKIPIEGIANQRTKREVIPKNIVDGYGFSNDATELFEIFDTDKPPNERRKYSDLRVLKSDIARRVKQIKEDDG